MPRPKEGYRNHAGLPIPGTSDIVGRFKDYSRLMFWAFSRGKQGHKELRDNTLDIGTAVHMMAELDLKGRPQRDIDFYLTATLREEDDRMKAALAFAAYRKWRATFHVDPYVQEVSLVSEKLQFGGTLDTIAYVRGGLGLVDFKTSKGGEVYEDHVLQLAAYGILWNETHPDEPLTEGYHLIVLPKDGSAPVHREFTHETLHPFRQKFWLYRQAFNYEGVTTDPKILSGQTVKPSPKPATKPRIRVEARSTPMTMGELLRNYGHINGASA